MRAPPSKRRNLKRHLQDPVLRHRLAYNHDNPAALRSVGTVHRGSQLLKGLQVMKIIGDSFFDNNGNLIIDDNLVGTSEIDSIIGRTGNDTIHAGGGNDGLIGNDGDDNLFGEGDNDTLNGGSGKDLLDGGSGIDTATYGGELSVTVDLSNSFAIGASSGFDTLVSIENVNGSSNDDIITGNSGNNVLQGLAGQDVLRGGFGTDVLTGGQSTVKDLTISDTFKFNFATESTPGTAHDVITDFVHGVDKIDVHAIDAKAGAINGEQDFTYIGSASFVNAQGLATPAQLRVEVVGDHTLVQGNIDFDSAPEFEVQLDGVTVISANDFVL
jgi:Ca2+-binding RTX toxin-like protein